MSGLKKESLFNEAEHWRIIKGRWLAAGILFIISGLIFYPTILKVAMLDLLIILFFYTIAFILAGYAGYESVLKKVATEVYVFGAFIKEGRIILSYLNGKWGLPRAKMKIKDLEMIDYDKGEYDMPFYNALSRGLGRIGISLINMEGLKIIPFFLPKNRMAIVIVMPQSSIFNKPPRLYSFTREKVKDLEIAPLMRDFIEKAMSAN
jgi:hypothetical protein